MNTEHGTNVFTTRYLEKWRSILLDACGIQHEHFFTDTECYLISGEFTLLSNAFDRLLDTGHPIVRHKDRRHFPNFNVTMQRIMDRHGIRYNKEDWPEPTTQECVKNSNIILNHLFVAIA